MDGVSAPRLAAGNTDPEVSVCGLNEVLGYVSCQNGNNIHSLADESTMPAPTLPSDDSVFSRIPLSIVCSPAKWGRCIHIQSRDAKKQKKKKKKEKREKALTTKRVCRETYWSSYCASCSETSVHTASGTSGCLQGWFGLRPQDGIA